MVILQTLLVIATVLSAADARKSYLVKDQINRGHLDVFSPRVMANDCQWCFFKDKNNEWCILGDLNWKVESKTSKYNQEDSVLSVPGHYRHDFKFQSTQSSTWTTNFQLKKLVANNIQYLMKEYTVGLKFEVYYWYKDAAMCINMAMFITPTEFDLISASQLEKCTRVIVKCLDDWSSWTDENELLFGTCTLSDKQDFSIYKYNPIETEFTHYFIGNDKYQENYCFPGPTPFYSPFDKYPNNWFYANWVSEQELLNALTVAWQGLPSFNPAFDGPVVRSSWDDIYANVQNAVNLNLERVLGN